MYALSWSLPSTHSSLRLLTPKLSISLNCISKGTKNSEYSIVSGGMAKFFRDHLSYSLKN